MRKREYRTHYLTAKSMTRFARELQVMNKE